ncbi:MAG: hypothetical protein Q9221_006028 [Calogaya cf. arnoldii]
MDFQDALDHSAGLKIPMPDSETLTRTRLDQVDIKEVERRGSPNTSPDLGNTYPSAHDPIESSDQEQRDEVYHDSRGEADPQRPTSERSNQGGSKAIPDDRPLGLAEVGHIVALKEYYQQRASSQQYALQNLTRTCGINGRLIPSLEHAHRAMADCYQNGDSTGFAKVYRTCENLVEACMDHPAEASLVSLEDPTDHRHAAPTSWYERLPPDCQEVIVSFLTNLRIDSNFLADRLSSLSFSELIELLGRSNTSRRPQSIFQGQPQLSTGGRSQSLPNQENELILVKLRNFYQGDPFFALSHGIFGTAFTKGSKEGLRKSRVWSTACARVIAEGRPGSDDFTTCTLDALFDSSKWSLKPQLETFITKVLLKGAFLVDPTSRESADLKEPLEIRNANAVIAKSNFFDQALKDLLGIITSSLPLTMLPEGLHTFITCILGKIRNAEVRTRARNFIVSKWFVSSILAQALTNPEEYGMMMCHHIGVTARNNILREISSRLQKQVYDVIFSWKFAGPILDRKMHSLTEQLLSKFDVSDAELGQKSTPPTQNLLSEEPVLMLNAHDVAGLIRALYPKLQDSASSANPSMAGSSTLVSESLWRGETGRSSAPSLSDLSLVGASAYRIEHSETWDAHLKPLDTKADNDATTLSKAKGNRSRITEDQLLRTYRCLTSTLQPLPTQAGEIASPDWALFRSDDDGNVQKSSSGETMLRDTDRVANQRTDVEEAGGDTMKGLKYPVARLLSLQTPQPELMRHHVQRAGIQPDEIKSELENLVLAAIDQASNRYDYQDLHSWWQTKILLENYEGSIDQLLRSIYTDCQRDIRMNRYISTRIDSHLYGLSSLQESQKRRLASEQQHRKAFRMKMWYVSDVRHSSTFEEALHVTQALRAMADSSRSKHPTGVANWARNRLRNVVGHDRTSAQTLDAMTEPNEYGGISKLNDDQVERTTRWLTRNSVENFCRGEERIHRFCLEIQKCANKLTGPTLLESPVLWSSPLFEHEKKVFGRKAPNTYEPQFQNVSGNSSYASNSHLMASLPIFPSQQSHRDARREVSSHWISPSQADGKIGVGPAKTQSILNDSFAREPVRSLPYHSPHTSLSAPGPVWPSDLSGQSQPAGNVHGAKETFAAEIKKGLYSLVLSDLGYLSWHSGSETDSWLRQNSLDDFFMPPGHSTTSPQSAEVPRQPRYKRMQDSVKAPRSLDRLLTAATATRQDPTSRWKIDGSTKSNTVNSIPERAAQPESKRSFPYRQTYKAILERFSMSDDPQTKLQRLHELEQLISQSIQEFLLSSSSARIQHDNQHSAKTDSLHLKSMLVPRTKATSFEEVMANCTERRAGTMRFKKAAKTPSRSPDTPSFGTDEIVNTLLSIFRDPELRPRTLFRDLQYIAAFVPAGTLDQTAQGKAFWDAGLAALAYKQGLCDAMIVRATDITTYHISATSSSSPTPPTVPPADLAHTTLRDAAELWIIAAKEGSATAARELGLLYLTHPELLPRTTLQPFSKPKEVFRTVGAKKEGSITEEGRLDPVTFAVVFHWMEVAANGGDKDARDFLRGNGEWGSGR